MKKEVIKSLAENFDSYANKTENNIEFWFARICSICLVILSGEISQKF